MATTLTSTSVRIVLIDGHAILRDGLRALLEAEADLRVVGEAGNGMDAVGVVQTTRPALVVTDLFMPGDSGMHLEKLRIVDASLRMLVLTAYADDMYIKAALQAGADGYLLKQAGRNELLRAIRIVLGGRKYFSASVSARLVAGYLGGREAGGRLNSWRISEREREVLTGIALGASNKRLANTLRLSVKTVEKHRANLMRKLALHNTAALTMFAVHNGFVPTRVSAGTLDDGRRDRERPPGQLIPVPSS
jgi:two-component system, NarL family, response regulator NreC